MVIPRCSNFSLASPTSMLVGATDVCLGLTCWTCFVCHDLGLNLSVSVGWGSRPRRALLLPQSCGWGAGAVHQLSRL